MKFARLHFGKAAQHFIAGSTRGRLREGVQCRSISHRDSTNEGKRRSSDRFKASKEFKAKRMRSGHMAKRISKLEAESSEIIQDKTSKISRRARRRVLMAKVQADAGQRYEIKMREQFRDCEKSWKECGPRIRNEQCEARNTR